MKKILQGATALAAILVAAPAFAEEGWYGRVDAGYGFDGEFSPGNRSGGFASDWNQSIGLGYGFQNGFRLEGEVAHRFNNIDQTLFADTSDVHTWSTMLNAIYDFSLSDKVHPYIGVGAGLARVDAGVTGVTSATPPVVSGIVNDSDTGFAYQGLVGIGLDLSDRLTMDFGYRYFAAPNLQLNSTGVFVGPGGESDYEQHAATIGLRWQFAAPPAPVVVTPPPPPPVAPPPPPPIAPPPPPPPLPPAACPTAGYVVYFEWDRSNLTPTAIRDIDQAVAAARNCNLRAVDVVGHTDTSGSPAYNQRLSERRAAVVREALVSRGVPAGVITERGVGEDPTFLAVRTGANERNPENRRSTFTITFR